MIILKENRILVEKVVNEVKEITTEAGIIVPTASVVDSDIKDDHERGKIVVKGPNVIDYDIGTIVVFDRLAGRNIILENKHYIILRDSDLTGEIPATKE